MKKMMCAAVLAFAASTVPAAAYDPYMGELRLFPYKHCPQDWAPAMGQILRISQYSHLFSLLGTRYGGDGSSTFALPNLDGPLSNSREGPEKKENTLWCIALKGMYPQLY